MGLVVAASRAFDQHCETRTEVNCELPWQVRGNGSRCALAPRNSVSPPPLPPWQRSCIPQKSVSGTPCPRTLFRAPYERMPSSFFDFSTLTDFLAAWRAAASDLGF